MSEHADDAFDRGIERDLMLSFLQAACRQDGRDGTRCDFERDDDGLLECSHCGAVFDD